MRALDLAATTGEPPAPDDDVDHDAGGESSVGEPVPVMDPDADDTPAWRGVGPSTPSAHQAAAVAHPDPTRPQKSWWLGRSSR
jgi:hypothetical protein